jgi:tRNA U34 5-carboxymethylaminomethyl modifying GTPase MnmE/TrmE
VDGRGIEALRTAVHDAVAALPPRSSPAALRMAVGLADCGRGLAAAAGELAGAADDAVVAGHLHRAVAALDEITGATIGTDLIDRIFSRHCVGK